MAELRTPRLVLRQWQEADLEPFAALNADPEVMRHFPGILTREQSDELAAGERARIGERGWGLWAVEHVERAAFLGYVGLLGTASRPTSRRPSRSAGGSRGSTGGAATRPKPHTRPSRTASTSSA